MSYDPTIGTWLEADPAEYVDGPDRYRAFDDAPNVLTDPFGYDPASTQPATQPSAPTDTKGVVAKVDVIVLLSNDLLGAKWKATWDLYKRTNPNVDVVQANAPGEIVDAAKAAFKRLHRKVYVVLIGHNNGQLMIGNNSLLGDPVPEPDDTPATYADRIQKGLNASGLANLKGSVASITFGACSGAATNDDRHLLQVFSNVIDANIAATKLMTTVVPDKNGKLLIWPVFQKGEMTQEELGDYWELISPATGK